MKTAELATVGTLAREFGVAVHQIEYAIKKLELRPAGRAANYAVYSDDDVARIGQELARIKEARAAKSPRGNSPRRASSRRDALTQ
jgi:DNA-binding transcriptional MerR regulator